MSSKKTADALRSVINAAEAAISAHEHGDLVAAGDYLHDVEDRVARARDLLALDVMAADARAPRDGGEQ